MTTIRTLRHGELPPPGVQPRRYHNSAGYVRLRWKVAPGELVECYEHRWIMGNPPPEFDVHHKNHIRDDNRPENLEVLTSTDHGIEHRRIDRSLAVRLYAEGCTTTEIGNRLGHSSSQVFRVLFAEGVSLRRPAEYLRISENDLPGEDIRFLHGQGVRSRRIAKFFGVSASVVDSRVRELGLTPHRGGRPSDAEIADASAAIRELIDR